MYTEIVYTYSRSCIPCRRFSTRKKTKWWYGISDSQLVEYAMGSTCSNLWKCQRLRILPDASTLIIGYPYTRPSRRRCSLYACREALRVAKKWLLQQNSSSATITIACESNYALNLLLNSTRLFGWGSAASIEELQFNGPGELYEANPDILYTIARTRSMLFFSLDRGAATTTDHHKNVTINFIASDNSR